MWTRAFLLLLAFLGATFCTNATATEKPVKKEENTNFGDRAWKATYGAGSAAANASLTALLTTMKTMGLITTAVGSSVKTFTDLGQPLWSTFARQSRPSDGQNAVANASPSARLLPAGYSPSETKLVCENCGQETLIRGDLPGLVIRCPSCEKVIKN